MVIVPHAREGCKIEHKRASPRGSPLLVTKPPTRDTAQCSLKGLDMSFFSLGVSAKLVVRELVCMTQPTLQSVVPCGNVWQLIAADVGCNMKGLSDAIFLLCVADLFSTGITDKECCRCLPAFKWQLCVFMYYTSTDTFFSLSPEG